MIRKNIVILADESVDAKEKKFFQDMQKYLNERRQNNVRIYYVHSNLFPAARGMKIDVLAVRADLPAAALRKLRKLARVMASINGPQSAMLD